MNKRCTKCLKMRSVSDFHFRSKARQVLNSRCKACTRLVIRNAYYKRRAYYLSKIAARNLNNKKKNQEFLYKLICTSSCVDCGEKNPVVLQFDHVRGIKKYSVGEMLNRRISLTTVKSEIKKCEVRCANCHAIKTAKQRGYHNYLNDDQRKGILVNAAVH